MSTVVMIALLGVGIGMVGLTAFLFGVYNRLIAAKNNADTALANIDIALKQRHDELPKLLEVCKGYMKYEKELLEKIVHLRTAFLQATGAEEKARLDQQLSQNLKSLFAVAENYPDLKANQNFLQLQSRVSGLESSLAGHRETYNAASNDYNIRIEQIPDVVIARSLGWTRKPMYAVSAEDREDVPIRF